MIMKETILELKTMFPAERFILTGSYVLAEYGLVEKSVVRDLDIILVKPEVMSINLINRFMKDFPAPTTKNVKALTIPKDEDDAEIKYQNAKRQTTNTLSIFMFNKHKVDIYTMDCFDEPVLLVNGIEYCTVPHIIAAKKSYNRVKDWLQCREIARRFFKPEEYRRELDKDWRSMLREGDS